MKILIHCITGLLLVLVSAGSVRAQGEAQPDDDAGEGRDVTLLASEQFTAGSGEDAFWMDALAPTAMRVSEAEGGLREYRYAPDAFFLAGSGIEPHGVFLDGSFAATMHRDPANEHLSVEGDQPELFNRINNHLDDRRQLDTIEPPAQWRAEMGHLREALPGVNDAPVMEFKLRELLHEGRRYLVWQVQTPAFTIDTDRGETIAMSHEYVLVTDEAFQEPILMVTRYWGQTVTAQGGLEPFHGQKVILGFSSDGKRLLLSPEEVPQLASVLRRFESPLPHTAAAGSDDAAAVARSSPQPWISNVRTAAFVLDLTAAAEAEGRSNIAVITAIGIGLAADSLFTRAVKGYGYATDNEGMKNYDGMLSEGAGLAAQGGTLTYGAVTGTDISEQDLEQADDVGELVGDTVGFVGGIWTGGAATKWATGQAIGLVRNGHQIAANALGVTANVLEKVGTFSRLKGPLDAHNLGSRWLNIGDDPGDAGWIKTAHAPGLDDAPGGQTPGSTLPSSFDSSGIQGYSNRYAQLDRGALPGTTIGPDGLAEGPRSSVAGFTILSSTTTTGSTFILPPGAVSTGGFIDASIDLPLQFRVFDTAVEDGDRVTLEVRSLSGRNLGPTDLMLTNAGDVFNPQVAVGPVEIAITALNEGDLSPNTGGLELQSNVVSGPSDQNFNLNEGETGVLRIEARQ